MKRGEPTDAEERRRMFASEGLKQQVVVIPKARDQLTFSAQRDETVQDGPAIRTAIDVVSKCYDEIILRGPDRLQNRVQRERTTVNVSNGYCSLGSVHSR